MQLDIHHYTVNGDPSHTVHVDFDILTTCGIITSTHDTDITADRFIVTGVIKKFDASPCTSEQLAASEKIAALVESNPRYDYDGKRLRLKGETITATFELVHKAAS